MSEDENPTELSPIERRLQARQAVEPSAALKSRIMGAVMRELDAPVLKIGNHAGFASFAAAMAAMLLLGLNLAVSTSAAPVFDRQTNIARPQTRDDALAIQQLNPDLSTADAMRMSLLLEAGGRIAPVPILHASGPPSGAISGRSEPTS